MNTSNRLINSMDRVQRQMVLENILNRAGQSLLDYIAVATTGAKSQNKKIKDYIVLASPEQGKFTVIGTKEILTLKEAVFLNGLNAHAPDFDDRANSGVIHPGSPILSLLLLLVQRYDAKTEGMLEAAVTGYGTSHTMAVSIQPGYEAFGYHVTGICGVLGITIATSYMPDFSEEERYNAFAAACISAARMLKALGDGPELEPYDMIKVTLFAPTSIQLARADSRGYPDPLGKNRGYFRVITGEEDIELRPVVLDGTYVIQKIYTEPYAFYRYTHPPIEAVIEPRNKYGLTAGDMESVHIETYSLAVSDHDHVDTLGSYSAEMSIPYSAAAGFLYSKAGLQEFSEAGVQDKVILDLAKRVAVVPDREISATFPVVRIAVVELKITDDGTLEKRVSFPREEPGNPLSDEEFKERHHGLMDYVGIGREVGSRISDVVYRRNMSVREILELFIAERRGPADE